MWLNRRDVLIKTILRDVLNCLFESTYCRDPEQFAAPQSHRCLLFLSFCLSCRRVWSCRFLRPGSLPQRLCQRWATIWPGPGFGSRSRPRNRLHSQSRIRGIGSSHDQLQQHPHPTRGPCTGQHSSRAASTHRWEPEPETSCLMVSASLMLRWWIWCMMSSPLLRSSHTSMCWAFIVKGTTTERVHVHVLQMWSE